ncbi:MAG: hypothetical protein RIB86_16445 [Imperialibacter sp.]
MEIKEFAELNALNKLLSKVKFHKDLDFDEFKDFVSSPIISGIYERLAKEYFSECKRLGYVKGDYKAEFNFNGRDGETLRKRIDNLTNEERTTLEENNAVEFYLRTLVSPLACNEQNFAQLREYFENCKENPKGPKY